MEIREWSLQFWIVLSHLHSPSMWKQWGVAAAKLTIICFVSLRTEPPLITCREFGLMLGTPSQRCSKKLISTLYTHSACIRTGALSIFFFCQQPDPTEWNLPKLCYQICKTDKANCSFKRLENLGIKTLYLIKQKYHKVLDKTNETKGNECTNTKFIF